MKITVTVEEAERLEALSYLGNVANEHGGPENWRCETITDPRSSEGMLASTGERLSIARAIADKGAAWVLSSKQDRGNLIR